MKHRSDQPITAVFFGGPHDGQRETLPDLRETWMFPHTIMTSDSVGPIVTGGVLYRLARTDGELIRNDRGFYRYEYQGMS